MQGFTHSTFPFPSLPSQRARVAETKKKKKKKKKMMMMKKKMVGFYLLLSLLPPMGLTVAGQEEGSLELAHLHEHSPQTIPLLTTPYSTNPPPTGVSVSKRDTFMVSSSVLAAENWLRTHVLSHFPSKNITTIVVGRGILCNRGQEHLWGLILPSMRSLHYSVVRWGLEKEIKVGADFSECLRNPALLSGFELEPLLSLLLQDAEFVCLVSSSQLEVAERLGLCKNGNIRVMKEPKPISRRLYSLRFGSNPFGFEAYGRHHMPPSFPFPPPPALAPNSPPEMMFPVPPMPPCSAAPTVALAPAPGSGEEGMGALWCVAKPTVPEEKLQEAMDYACGEGGADCDEIKPNGSCFYPDNVVAHASYAFNSYWQKTKQGGGSCGFDGTALLIDTDPSFLQCRFVLS